MAKVSGNYSSLVRGVSQQAPADRLEGQHGEVLNMLSDPVRGLVRRNGMVMEDSVLTTLVGDTSNATADSFSYRTFSYLADGRELDLIYRSRAKIGSSGDHLAGIIAYDKTPGEDSGFIEVVTDPDDDDLDAFLNGGISAVANVGSYVLFAGGQVEPSYTSEDQVEDQDWTDYAVAWVRGGVYARTYTITAKKASTGVTYQGTYTTMTAAYAGTLDLTGLNYSDPDYQKQVNDLTYAYEAAVNQHISQASESIVPSNIAQELIDSLDSAGFSGWTRNGSHIAHTDVAHVTVTDNGDGSQFVALRNETSAADEVTEMHYPGKVVKVQPRTANAEAFYLKAAVKDGGSGTDLQPVVWRETAGVLQTPSVIFAIGVYHEGAFYVASSPALLEALVLAEAGDTIEVPDYVPSAAGDADSAKAPHFFGRKITALSVFQDRLVVVSDSTVNMSRTGDYFNFYRSSVLTVADDDPIEAYALGSEGDTIRQAVLYDRNLLLAGDKAHYIMSGRIVHTPSTAAIAPQFSVANTAGARPQGTGPLLFWLKEDTQLAATRLLQVRGGIFQDNPQLDDVSRQLRDYVNGTPAEVVVLSNPDIVFVRTEHFLKSQGAYPRARPWGLYVYQFMDDPQGKRIVDAWSAWEWSSSLGTPIGITASASADGIMLYTLAWGRNEDGTPVRAILAQSASARPDPTGLPYLDGMRPADAAEDDGLFTAAAVPFVKNVTYTASGAANSYVAVMSTSDASRFAGLEHPHYTMGDAPPETVDSFRWTGARGNRSDFITENPGAPTNDLWTGAAFPAYVDPTPPFVRDRNGKAKTWGRLILSRLRATLIRSAGFEASWIDHIGTKTTTHFDGEYERIRYGVNLWIGRDSRDVQVRLAAKDWLPLTINALEWAGQWFEPRKG